MSVSMQDVRTVLDPDEPDYDAVAALGAEAVPHLQALVEGESMMLAAKAAYAAGLLEGDQGEGVLRAAARSGRAEVRVAAASAVAHMPGVSAATVLSDLADDDDPGVRRVALKSAPDDAPPELVDRLRARSSGGGRPGEEA